MLLGLLVLMLKKKNIGGGRLNTGVSVRLATGLLRLTNAVKITLSL